MIDTVTSPEELLSSSKLSDIKQGLDPKLLVSLNQLQDQLSLPKKQILVHLLLSDVYVPVYAASRQSTNAGDLVGELYIPLDLAQKIFRIST